MFGKEQLTPSTNKTNLTLTILTGQIHETSYTIRVVPRPNIYKECDKRMGR